MMNATKGSFLKALLIGIIRGVILWAAIKYLKKYAAHSMSRALQNSRGRRILGMHMTMVRNGQDLFFKNLLKELVITGTFMEWDVKRDTLNVTLLSGISFQDFKYMSRRQRDEKLVEYVVERNMVYDGDQSFVSTATLVYRIVYQRDDNNGQLLFMEKAIRHDQLYGVNDTPGTTPVSYPAKVSAI